MAYVQLKETQNVDLEETISVASGQTSDWYGMPQNLGALAMQLVPAGSARVEYTLDREGAKNDTATGVPWPDGDVSVVTDDNARGVAAIRLVSASGTADLFIRGNRG